MKKIKYPKRKSWNNLISRPEINSIDINQLVINIFDDIKKNGDKAVRKYRRLYETKEPGTFIVSKKTIKESSAYVSKKLKTAIKIAYRNIEMFHESQREKIKIIETMKGIRCWREGRPIEKVGIYIPGGTAPLFSTVLMLGIPAKIAGCKEIILCTPPDKSGNINPVILYAASLVGITSVYCVGGIQAIGAMAFGTESIPRVDKIFGPGNQFVTAAKLNANFMGVAIDMPAGPSEVLIIADKTSNPVYVAADLLSQAEHGTDSQVILLSDNEKIIDSTITEIKKQITKLPRRKFAEGALKNSKAILLKDYKACIDFSNLYAPEHLILALNKAKKIVPLIINAGSVFMGNYSCESAGDYASGTNHTLPTNGNARSHSGISLDSFLKKITFQEISRRGLQNIGTSIEIMAEAEMLYAHKNAVSVRLKSK